MGLQPRASASCRMLTPSTPCLANRFYATAHRRARKASTSALDRFLGMVSGIERQRPRELAHVLEKPGEVAVRGHEHPRPEADRVEHGRVLRDELPHEGAQLRQPLRRTGPPLPPVLPLPKVAQ